MAKRFEYTNDTPLVWSPPSGAYNGLGTLAVPMTQDSIGAANGITFMETQLGFMDNVIREPLTSSTWMRHLPIQTGGGWDEFEYAVNIDYGETGGMNGDLGTAGGSNSAGIIQMNPNRDVWKTHIYDRVIKISDLDLERASMLNWPESLEQLLQKGLHISYDAHANINAYVGCKPIGTTGLVNSDTIGVPAYTASYASGNGGSTKWVDKAYTQIQNDVNGLIDQVWSNAAYSQRAIPNTVLLPPAQYSYINTTIVGTSGFQSILTYLKTNNLYTAQTGKELCFDLLPFLTGAGVGPSDRMLTYVMDLEFIGLRELMPLTRRQTSFENDAYVTHYKANLGQVKFHSFATIGYLDGI